jgi:hypothetical protein
VAREQFAYSETAPLLNLLDQVVHRSGVSRGQAFDDFLQMSVCSLSGGRMEEQYLATVEKYCKGAKGKRGVDSLAELFGRMVAAMEYTRDNIKDILGDLFVGAISYGEAGQYFSPMPICRVMARLTIDDLSEEAAKVKKTVCDPACGSGRMLLAVAETYRHFEFIGQDIDLRCTRMTAINLALRNLYGYAVCGNSLSDEVRCVYRTGFNGLGFVREATVAELHQQFGEDPQKESSSGTTNAAEDNSATESLSTNTTSNAKTDNSARKQLRLF